MNDKLLKAFIEASGYTIETTPKIMTDERRKFLESENMHFTILTEGAECDYKVTKKKPQVCFDVDSPEWSCIVNFVLGHKEDIINDINDYGGLGLVLDFFNRNS